MTGRTPRILDPVGRRTHDAPSLSRGGSGIPARVEVPHLARLPDTCEQRQRRDRHQPAGDVDELDTDKVAPEELHDGERATAHDDGGPDPTQAAPAAHRHDKPRGNEKRDERQLTSGHCAERRSGNAGDRRERQDRRADRAKGHRGGVGDKRKPRRIERREAKTDEQRRADGDRRAETGGPFDKRAERKRDEQRLHPPVARQSSDRRLDDVELAGIDRQVIEKDGVEDDPADRQETIRRAVDGGGGRGRKRHAVHERGNGERGQQAGERGIVRAPLENPERREQQDDRQRGCQRAQPRAGQRVVDLNPRRRRHFLAPPS